MKYQAISSFGLKYFFVLTGFLLVLSQCSNSENDKKLLENKAEKVIGKDIKDISVKCVDNLSAGIGGAILDFTMTKQEQDSILLSPVLPYIKEELKKKNNEELNEIITSPKQRIKLIGSTIVANKDNIINSVTSKYSFAKSLIESVIKYIQDNQDKIENLTK